MKYLREYGLMELRKKDIKRKMLFSFLLLFTSIFFFINGMMQLTFYKVLPKESAVLLSAIKTEYPKEAYNYNLFIQYYQNREITIKTNLKNNKKEAIKICEIAQAQAEIKKIDYKKIIVINRENMAIFQLENKGQKK